jgi:hypothetical protein
LTNASQLQALAQQAAFAAFAAFAKVIFDASPELYAAASDAADAAIASVYGDARTKQQDNAQAS